MSTTDARIVAARRQRLREWIDRHYEGSQAAFVAATRVNQGELSGLLRNKSFGEKRAATMEQCAGMPAGYLVSPLSDPGPSPSSQPMQLDEGILADAWRVIRAAAELAGTEPVYTPRAVAIAYALLQDSRERVNADNIVRLVKSFLDRTEERANGERESA